MDNITTGQTVSGNTGSPITFGNQVVPDFDNLHSFTVKGHNSWGTTTMNGEVNIYQSHTYADAVSVSASANPVLEPGNTVTLTASATYVGDLTWQWYLNGSPVGESWYQYPKFPATYTLADGDQLYVKMTDNYPCLSTPNPVSSNTFIMNVVDHVWTGDNSGSWNDAGNWNPSSIPSSDANIYFTQPNGPSLGINTSVTCHNIIVKNTWYFSISYNGSLTLTGTLTLNGPDGLYIQSNSGGTGSLIDNGIAGTGTAYVETSISKDVWHYLSSPISDATANNFPGDYLMASDPTNSSGWGNWISDPSTPLQVMRGYSCWKPSTSSTSEAFDGHLNTGTETFTGNRTATDPNAGWHLVGNPFPSSINLTSSGITWDQFEPTAYFYDGSQYLAYPTTDGLGTHSQYVPPEQGFFVHINDSHVGTSTLTFTNSARTHSTESFLKDTPAIQNEFFMVASGSANAYSDRATVHFNPDATSGYDPGYDAYKLQGLNEAPQLYTSVGDTKVTCNSLPFDKKNMVIPMGFSCGLPGTYTLTADSLRTFENAISISLEDLKLNITQDLRTNPVYSFVYDTIDNPNRFVLHFYNPTFGVTNLENIQPVQIYSFGNAIYIRSHDGNLQEGTVFIYDLVGKEIFLTSLSDKILNRITPEVAEGFYLVRVMTNLGAYNAKVYLTNQ